MFICLKNKDFLDIATAWRVENRSSCRVCDVGGPTTQHASHLRSVTAVHCIRTITDSQSPIKTLTWNHVLQVATQRGRKLNTFHVTTLNRFHPIIKRPCLQEAALRIAAICLSVHLFVCAAPSHNTGRKSLESSKLIGKWLVLRVIDWGDLSPDSQMSRNNTTQQHNADTGNKGDFTL